MEKPKKITYYAACEVCWFRIEDTSPDNVWNAARGHYRNGKEAGHVKVRFGTGETWGYISDENVHREYVSSLEEMKRDIAKRAAAEAKSTSDASIASRKTSTKKTTKKTTKEKKTKKKKTRKKRTSKKKG